MNDLLAEADEVMGGEVVQLPPPARLAPAELQQFAEAAIPPLPALWAKYRDGFASAMSAFQSIDKLEDEVRQGRCLFLPGKECALIAQVHTYPGGQKVFQALWATGDLDELVSMTPGVEAIARMQGCESVLIEGRPAWRRHLAKAGYQVWSQTLHKAL